MESDAGGALAFTAVYAKGLEAIEMAVGLGVAQDQDVGVAEVHVAIRGNGQKAGAPELVGNDEGVKAGEGALGRHHRGPGWEGQP